MMAGDMCPNDIKGERMSLSTLTPGRSSRKLQQISNLRLLLQRNHEDACNRLIMKTLEPSLLCKMSPVKTDEFVYSDIHRNRAHNASKTFLDGLKETAGGNVYENTDNVVKRHTVSESVQNDPLSIIPELSRPSNSSSRDSSIVDTSETNTHNVSNNGTCIGEIIPEQIFGLKSATPQSNGDQIEHEFVTTTDNCNKITGTPVRVMAGTPVRVLADLIDADGDHGPQPFETACGDSRLGKEFGKELRIAPVGGAERGDAWVGPVITKDDVPKVPENARGIKGFLLRNPNLRPSQSYDSNTTRHANNFEGGTSPVIMETSGTGGRRGLQNLARKYPHLMPSQSFDPNIVRWKKRLEETQNCVEGGTCNSEYNHFNQTTSTEHRPIFRGTTFEEDMDRMRREKSIYIPSYEIVPQGTSRDYTIIKRGEQTMQKAKSPTTRRKILPKKWRSKTKALPAPNVTSSTWTPQGSCTWVSKPGSGRQVFLKAVNLVDLCEKERHALQKIVLAKLQDLQLGGVIVIPKGDDKNGKTRRRPFSLKKRTNSKNLSDLIDNIKDKLRESNNGKENQVTGIVFGIPLSKCILNDMALRRRRLSSLRDRQGSLDISVDQNKSQIYDSCASLASHQPSPMKSPASSPAIVQCGSIKTGASDTDSVPGSPVSKNSGLIDALLLSDNATHKKIDKRLSLMPATSHTPHIVNTCFKHLETYGLQVPGIFRVSGSKKRTKQLREEFDSGREVKLSQEHSPHDVAALLKEFFRDLPDPLLTRELYAPFVTTAKFLNQSDRLMTYCDLVCLLPVANRNTLHALLKFLAEVTEHSADSVDVDGQELTGNKMDSHNLATLFGPNILHNAKTGVDYQVETVLRAEDRDNVIKVIQEMIEHHAVIFKISAELHDEVLRILLEIDPESLDYLLNKRATRSSIEEDLESVASSCFGDSESSLPRSPNSDLDTKTSQSPPCRSLSETVALQQPRKETVHASYSDQYLRVPHNYVRHRHSSPDNSITEANKTRHGITWGHSSPALYRRTDRFKPPDLRICETAINDSPYYRTEERLGSGACDASCSSLSSYYPSASNSPSTPDKPMSWTCETPPASPSLVHRSPSPVRDRGYSSSRGNSPILSVQDKNGPMNISTSGLLTPPDRPSSTSMAVSSKWRPLGSQQRPLGLPVQSDWDENKWKQWDDISGSRDFHEQETLV